MDSFKWFIFILIAATVAFGALYFLDCKEQKCCTTQTEVTTEETPETPAEATTQNEPSI